MIRRAMMTASAVMRAAVIDDPPFGPVAVRAAGRAMHVSTIPPGEAFRPLDQGGCPLVTK